MSLKDIIGKYFYNDTALLPVFLLTCLVSLFILGASIYFHELGHWLYFRIKLKKKVKMHFKFNNIYSFYFSVGDSQDYVGLNKIQYKRMMIFGFLFGLLPIFFCGYVWIWFTALIIPYMAGSWADLKEVFGDVKIE